jgi:hypothetical protein
MNVTTYDLKQRLTSRALISAGIFLLCAAGVAMSLPAHAAGSTLTAAQVVDRNVAARGGLAAWRAVRTLSWSGKMEAGGNNARSLPIPGQKPAAPVASTKEDEQVQLPFVLQMARPKKSRLELQFNGQTAVQVYDGSQGWKLRPFLNRNDAEAFTADELKVAASQADIDGLLIDYAAKGSAIALEGTEKVDGRDAYKLKVTFKDQQVRHVWVDAQSFLELRIEGTPRRLDGRLHPVFVYMSDYKTDSGLQIPHLIETRIVGVKRTEKINIESVKVNPPLAESLFAKPQLLASAAK